MATSTPRHGGADARTGHDTRTVRPRWAWAGLLLLVVGGVLTGLAATSLLPAVPGVVLVVGGVSLLALGAASALRGDLFYDTHASISPSAVARDLADGATREEPAPGARIVAAPARENALAEARTTHALQQDRSYPRPSPAPLGVALMLVACVWLLLAVINLFPDSGAGDWAGIRDGALATVIALAALALRLPGRHPVAWLAATGGAVLLVLLGAVADTATVVRADDLVVGVLVLLAASVAVSKLGGTTGLASGRTTSGPLGSASTRV